MQRRMDETYNTDDRVVWLIILVVFDGFKGKSLFGVLDDDDAGNNSALTSANFSCAVSCFETIAVLSWGVSCCATIEHRMAFQTKSTELTHKTRC